MKRLWIAGGLLIFILAASLINNWVLAGITGEMTDLLREAESCYEAGDILKAVELTQEARQKWEDASGYLYIVLRHTESDAVLVRFTETLQYLNCGEPGGEYAAANASLIAQIELLHEMEQLNLKNLL